MVDLAPMFGWNQIVDVRMPVRWTGKYLGYNTYEYTMDAPEEKYIAMTGVDVDSYFSVPADFCLAELKLKQVTAAGVDSNAPISYELWERNSLTQQYGPILQDAGNFLYWSGRQGRGWESSACDLMLRLNGVDGHLVYPIVTLQFLKPVDRYKRNR